MAPSMKGWLMAATQPGHCFSTCFLSKGTLISITSTTRGSSSTLHLCTGLSCQGFRGQWPLQTPTTTGSMGQRASWCFSTNSSCAMAAGTGWQTRSGGTGWWRAQELHPKGRGGALSTLNFSGMMQVCAPSLRQTLGFQSCITLRTGEW